MSKAKELIGQLGLEAHPEGGWYAETWRAPAKEGERASSTAIYFLLEAGQRSHWHRVDADELWLWHAGDPLQLAMAESDEGPVEKHILGPHVPDDEHPQIVVPAGTWQAARPVHGGLEKFTLVSCVVAPAFGFDGFELAEPDWSPG